MKLRLFLLASLCALWSCASTVQQDYTLAYVAMESGDLDTAYDLFLPLARNGNAASMTNLAYIEHQRGNNSESKLWTDIAALMGDEVSIKYLGANGPKSVVYGAPLDDRILMCDLLLDSARVLPELIAIKFKLLTKYSSTTEFSVNSLLEGSGEAGYLLDINRNTTYLIPGNGFVIFTGLVNASATDAKISLTCDGDTSVISVPVQTRRVTSALQSFGGDKAAATRTEVTMKKSGGVYEVPVTLNGVLKIDFILDSGAAEIYISPDVAMTLQRTGTITASDWLPGKTYKFADGSTAKSRRFLLSSVQIGGRTFEDVPCAIANDISAPMLLGQSVLERLGGYRVDYENSALVIE